MKKLEFVLIGRNGKLKKPLVKISQEKSGNIAYIILSGAKADGSHFSIKTTGDVHFKDFDPPPRSFDEDRVNVARVMGWKNPEVAKKYIPFLSLNKPLAEWDQPWSIGAFGFAGNEDWSKGTKYDGKATVKEIELELKKDEYIRVQLFVVPKGTEKLIEKWKTETEGKKYIVETIPPVWVYVKTTLPPSIK